jgi:hypothetical protein
MVFNVQADDNGMTIFYNNGSLQINNSYTYENEKLIPKGKDLGAYADNSNLSYDEYDSLETIFYEVLKLYDDYN